MTKLIKHSKENISVKREAINYSPTSNDLSGHLKGIDNALGNSTGNGGGGDQNNFVKNIYIDIYDLDFGESTEISASVINDYLSNLSDEEKTIIGTTSKTNIVIYSRGYSS